MKPPLSGRVEIEDNAKLSTAELDAFLLRIGA